MQISYEFFRICGNSMVLYPLNMSTFIYHIHILYYMYDVVNIIIPLYSDEFSHTDKSNKDGIVHYIF